MEEQPKNATSRGILRNVLYSFSTWLLPFGLSFAATPIIVRNLGHNDYGIYALVLGIVGYTFNVSFGRAVTKYIAEFRAGGEQEKIHDVISAALFINVSVGLFGLTAICLSARWLVIVVYQIEPADQGKSINALYVAALIIFSLTVSQIFSSILQGIHRFDVYSKIFNFNTLAMLSGNLVLAYNGYGLLSLLVWNLCVNALSCAIYAVGAKRLLPEFGLNFKLKPEYFKLVLYYSIGIIGYQILANILLLFERGWITRQLGTENLTYYVIPMSLSFYIHGFVSSLILVIFPLASELGDNPEKLLRLYTKATKIVCFFVVFMAMTLIVESHLFLSLWMGAEFADKTYLLLILHTITFSLVSIQAVSWQMTEGLGYPSYNTFIFVICLILNVFVMITLTPSYGNVGIALGRLIGFGTIFFSVFYVEKWFFKGIKVKFWLKLIGQLGAAAIISAGVQKIIVSNFEVGWVTFLSASVAGGAIYCLMVFILGFVSEDERLLVKNLLGR